MSEEQEPEIIVETEEEAQGEPQEALEKVEEPARSLQSPSLIRIVRVSRVG